MSPEVVIETRVESNLLNLWSSFRPRRSERLPQFPRRAGTHAPAARWVHRRGYCRRVLQSEDTEWKECDGVEIPPPHRTNNRPTLSFKADHNVSDAFVDFLKGQRGDSSPHVQSLADSFVHIGLLQIRSIIYNPERSEQMERWAMLVTLQISTTNTPTLHLNVRSFLFHLSFPGKYEYAATSGTPHLARFISATVSSSRLPVTWEGSMRVTW